MGTGRPRRELIRIDLGVRNVAWQNRAKIVTIRDETGQVCCDVECEGVIGEDIVSCRLNRSRFPEPCLADREARTEVVVVCVRRPGKSVSSIPILPDRHVGGLLSWVDVVPHSH